MTSHLLQVFAASLALGVAVLTPTLQNPAFRMRVDGVRVDVTVTDGGKPVTGLTTSDFAVLDNEIGQRIDSIATAGTVAVTMVLDTSDSVRPQDQHPRQMYPQVDNMTRLKAAGRQVIDALRVGDSGSIVTFDQWTVLRQRPTTDLLALRRAMTQVPLSQYSQTTMWDGLLLGAAVAASSVGRPVVILLSDGADTASWIVGDGPAGGAWFRQERSRTIDALAGAGVTVDVIWGERPGGSIAGWDWACGSDYLGVIAEKTGGVRTYVGDKQLAQKIDERLNELRSSYVLTYSPSVVKQGDGWHSIKVSLKRGKGKVTARRGYFSR